MFVRVLWLAGLLCLRATPDKAEAPDDQGWTVVQPQDELWPVRLTLRYLQLYWHAGRDSLSLCTSICSREIGSAILLLWERKSHTVLVQSDCLPVKTEPSENALRHTRRQMCRSTRTKGRALGKLIWHEISRQDLTERRVVTVEQAAADWTDSPLNQTPESRSRCFSCSRRRREPKRVRCDRPRITATFIPTRAHSSFSRLCSHCCSSAAVYVHYAKTININQLLRRKNNRNQEKPRLETLVYISCSCFSTLVSHTFLIDSSGPTVFCFASSEQQAAAGVS